MNVVKFAYYDEFHCTGPECLDSCCKDWHIHINKKEYLNYKKMKCSPELQSIIGAAFKRHRNGEAAYAEMRLKENGYCPFCGEDSLCMLQRELGEEALSFTCNTFPRLIANVGGNVIRQSCASTCFHVIELLMRHPEGLLIVEEEYDGKNKFVNKGLYSSYSILKSWKDFPYYWSILNAQIDILQNRAFTVPERMLILGYFCQKAEEYTASGSGEKIPSLSSMLADGGICRKIADSLTSGQSDGAAAAQSLEILLKMNVRIKGANLPNYTKMFEKVMNRLGCDLAEKDNGRLSLSFDYNEYARLCSVYRKIESERSYITENLLVNQIFASNHQEGIWKNYFTLAVFYNMLKICVPVFLTENYDDRELALALTYTVKMFINTHIAEQGTFEDFAAENKHTLPYAALLIC